MKGNFHLLHTSVSNRAAKGGHLEVLKWARENGCPEYDTEYLKMKMVMMSVMMMEKIMMISLIKGMEPRWH